jgi:predicted DNA-binding transcriptional regulator YafY
MALTNRTLILFKYLWETTDEAHPVSLADISAHLKEYGITADPRTLRRDIEQLVEFGVDIVKDRRVQNLYHVASRHFEAPEVKLLIDAVQSARFITPKKSKDLVKRLTAFAAPGDAALLKRHLYIDSRVKAANENVYISVDRIQAAIAERKKITFRYFDYAPSTERVHRHGGQLYSVSPYALLWNNDIYYLVGFHDHRQQVAKFRVDRIVQMEILDETAVKKPTDFDVSEFFTQEFSMLNGKECTVTLLCKNILMNSIIDRFGEDVPVETVDASHFSAQVTVDLSRTFYGWVFASAGKMKITEPQEAVEGFRKMLENFQE